MDVREQVYCLLKKMFGWNRVISKNTRGLLGILLLVFGYNILLFVPWLLEGPESRGLGRILGRWQLYLYVNTIFTRNFHNFYYNKYSPTIVLARLFGNRVGGNTMVDVMREVTMRMFLDR